MIITMFVFAMVMFILNYLFVTPTYLTQKPTWYTDLPFVLDINSFNQQYGTNMSVPGFLNFLSPYGQAILSFISHLTLSKGLFLLLYII